MTRRPALALVLALAACAPDPPAGLLDTGPAVPWRSLSTGGEHACVLDEGGNAYCWGLNAGGELGTAWLTDSCGVLGSVDDNSWGVVAELSCTRAPVAVQGGVRFQLIRASHSSLYPNIEGFTCGVDLQGQLWCWGSNHSGGPGVGRAPQDPFDEYDPACCVAAPARVPGMADVRSLSLGARHACAVHADGTVQCWGHAELGALGTGEVIATHPAPVAVAGLPGPVDEVLAGDTFSCAAKGARIWCWGGNVSRTAPAEVPLPAGVTLHALSAAQDHACGQDAQGRLWCWSLQDGDSGGAIAAPADAGAGAPSAAAAAGRLLSWCATGTDGVLRCQGTLGIVLGYGGTGVTGQELKLGDTPTVVDTGGAALHGLSAGGQLVCGLDDAGAAYCLGEGQDGQPAITPWADLVAHAHKVQNPYRIH